MIHSKIKLFCIILLICGLRASAQEFIPLWPSGKIPNSKGLNLKDSIVNERYFRVGVPGMYVYLASPGKNQGASVIICPGGGYHHFAYVSSGTDVAKWFNSLGINAFVLISRLPVSPDLVDRSKGPLQDAQRAIRLIRANAKNWKIKTDKIGIIGFSAGGHVASSLGTHTEDISALGDSLDKQPFLPDFMLLVSPVISMGKFAHVGSRDNLLGKNPSPELIEKYSSELQVTVKTPPAFIVHADNDKTVNPQNSILFYQALREKKIPASLHIFPQGGHAIGMGDNPGSTALWTKLCEMWLMETGIIN